MPDVSAIVKHLDLLKEDGKLLGMKIGDRTINPGDEVPRAGKF
jgi:hypothetical protein